MFRMTPVSAYWIVLTTSAPVVTPVTEPVGTGTLPPTVMVASVLSVASRVGVESTVTLVLEATALRSATMLCGIRDPAHADSRSRRPLRHRSDSLGDDVVDDGVLVMLVDEAVTALDSIRRTRLPPAPVLGWV